MRSRKWVQIVSTFFHNGYLGFLNTSQIYNGFLKNFCAPGLNCHSCPSALFCCPLGMIQNFNISLRVLPLTSLIGPFFYLLSFFLFFGLTLGRFICGWLCPFGFFQELLYRIPFYKNSSNFKGQDFFKISLTLLFVFILPILIISELGYGILWFCKFFCPAGTLEAGYFNLFFQPFLFKNIGYVFYLKTLLLLMIILLCIINFRFFCKTACPLGLIYGYFNRISIVKLTLEEKRCPFCKICEKVCPMRISLPEKLDSKECIRCLICLKVCPYKAIKLKISHL
ncbi:MAG: 4Fe-4S binding protein [Thermodesulfobacteriaceae bacterium]|nr:4Fe-4S binding protein [Thermodesulfobacteriaceae bacterium]MDW8135746.1 4Fe-4S binding protein [Thermodesulfobacterium sp.]